MRGRLLFLLPQIGLVLIAVAVFAAHASAAEVTIRVTGLAVAAFDETGFRDIAK